VTLFGNIQAKEKSQGHANYVPPAGLAPPDVQGNIDHLAANEKNRRSKLNHNLREILEHLRKEFATPANEFYAALSELKIALAHDTHDLETTHAHLVAKQAEVEALANSLPHIQQAEQRCDEANIEDNEYSDHTYEDLEFEHSQVNKNYHKKISFIEAQIAAAKERHGVSPEQLQEFKETFSHFDSQKKGYLTKLDFKSCLSGLGVVELDFEGGNAVFEAIFKRVSQESETISFDQFVDYLISITADTVSPQQLTDSFDTIAQGKDHITVNDMKVAQLSADQIAFLSSSLPPHHSIAGGYDYKSWLKTQFH